MTSQPLYRKPHPVCRATYTLYMRHHSHYLCPHSHCIDNITATLCMISHSPYVWHRLPIQEITSSFYDLRPPCLCHHTTIFVIVSTESVSSHPLYWWYHTNCISEITSAIIHDIIYIVYDMTACVWHHNHCIHDIRFPIYDITSRVYVISSPIPVTSQTLCLWIHVNYI